MELWKNDYFFVVTFFVVTFFVSFISKESCGD